MSVSEDTGIKNHESKRKREDDAAEDLPPPKKQKLESIETQILVAQPDREALIQQLTTIVKQLQAWDQFSEQILDLKCAYDAELPTEPESLRNNIQAKYDILNISNYIALLNQLKVKHSESDKMVKFLQANLIAPQDFGMFGHQPTLTPQSPPHKIKHWTYQQGISEMQYQQSGIYPLLADAFDSLQDENLCYHA